MTPSLAPLSIAALRSERRKLMRQWKGARYGTRRSLWKRLSNATTALLREELAEMGRRK